MPHTRDVNEDRHYEAETGFETKAEARRCMDYIADVNGTYDL